jgi:hypothetical protein
LDADNKRGKAMTTIGRIGVSAALLVAFASACGRSTSTETPPVDGSGNRDTSSDVSPGADTRPDGPSPDVVPAAETLPDALLPDGTSPICPGGSIDSGACSAVDPGIDAPPADGPTDGRPTDGADVKASEAGDLDAGALDGTSETRAVPCAEKPITGDPCAPLPANLVCWQGTSCAGGCAQECTCNNGRWQCNKGCRDYFTPTDGGWTLASCGTPPLCPWDCFHNPIDASTGE